MKTEKKTREPPIQRSKVFLNKTDFRANNARKINTKRRRAVTWRQFHTDRNLQIVKSWARKGWTNEEIADKIGIVMSTFYEWQKKHPEFSEALSESREYCVAVVENAVYERSKGIRTTTKSSRTITVLTKDADGNTEGVKKTTIEVEHEVFVPPNPAAQKFFLTNRAPDDWSNKQQTELAGNLNIDTKTTAADKLKEAIRRKEASHDGKGSI